MVLVDVKHTDKTGKTYLQEELGNLDIYVIMILK
jgi:hypothetical protein